MERRQPKFNTNSVKVTTGSVMKTNGKENGFLLEMQDSINFFCHEVK